MKAATAQLVFVTGLSGSGKSMAARVLEDLGYYVLDNLPSPLIPKFVELLTQSEEGIAHAALIVDLRDRTFTRDFPKAFADLKAQGHDARLLFLEAADDVLLRRFSETRRTHPLSGTKTQAIEAEREALAPLRSMADRVVDTSSLNVHSLGQLVVEWLHQGTTAAPTLTLTILTFGFKYGVPRDADWLFDVRFLPNPFFVPGLKERTGYDEAVSGYVWQSPAAEAFVTRACDILRQVTPLYLREARTHLTVAVGCTGGRHRSIAIAREMARRLHGGDTRVLSVDRDIDKQ